MPKKKPTTHCPLCEADRPLGAVVCPSCGVQYSKPDNRLPSKPVRSSTTVTASREPPAAAIAEALDPRPAVSAVAVHCQAIRELIGGTGLQAPAEDGKLCEDLASVGIGLDDLEAYVRELERMTKPQRLEDYSASVKLPPAWLRVDGVLKGRRTRGFTSRTRSARALLNNAGTFLEALHDLLPQLRTAHVRERARAGESILKTRGVDETTPVEAGGCARPHLEDLSAEVPSGLVRERSTVDQVFQNAQQFLEDAVAATAELTELLLGDDDEDALTVRPTIAIHQTGQDGHDDEGSEA